MLWVASDWPMHDIGEQYLYSAHMLQHMMLSYFLPPLVLLATPEWLLRLLVGNGRTYAVLRVAGQPVVAGVVFNVIGDDHAHPGRREQQRRRTRRCTTRCTCSSSPRAC